MWTWIPHSKVPELDEDGASLQQIVVQFLEELSLQEKHPPPEPPTIQPLHVGQWVHYRDEPHLEGRIQGVYPIHSGTRWRIVIDFGEPAPNQSSDDYKRRKGSVVMAENLYPHERERS